MEIYVWTCTSGCFTRLGSCWFDICASFTQQLPLDHVCFICLADSRVVFCHILNIWLHFILLLYSRLNVFALDFKCNFWLKFYLSPNLGLTVSQFVMCAFWMWTCSFCMHTHPNGNCILVRSVCLVKVALIRYWWRPQGGSPIFYTFNKPHWTHILMIILRKIIQ